MAAVTETANAAGHHRSVGVWGAAALVAGSMVGSGVYVLPATLAAIGSISVLGWAAATLTALAIGGVFILLSPLVPKAEGLPDYVRAGLGPFFAVQATVAYCVTNWVGTVAIALAVAGAAGYLAPALAGTVPRLILTLASIWLGVAACWVGPRLVARVEGFTLAAGLLPVVVAALFGWVVFQPSVFVQSWNPQGLGVGQALGASALTAFWAFLGVECAAAAAGAVRDPARNVPRATLIGVLGAAALYIAACTVLMGILPAAQLGASTAPFAAAGQHLLGVGLGAAFAVCALLRAQGCLTGWMLVTAETSRSGADAGAFPAVFRSRPGERVSTVNVLTAGGLMSLVAIGTATPTLGEQFGTLANIAVILSLYTYALAGGSLARISGRLAPRIVAGAAILGSLAIMASGKPLELLLCVVPVAAAAVLYLVLRRR
jgi:arginine:agmatine antiporter